MVLPMNFDKINLATSTYTPNTIKTRDNEAFRYWERSLLQRAFSVIEIENLPESWKGEVKDFLYYCLYGFGFVAVGFEKEYDIYFQPATLKGRNLYYQPTSVIISNPAFNKSKELKLGTDAELIRLTPDYRGIFDIIDYYAEKLALINTSTSTSLINTKMPFILGAKNRQAAQALKKMLDKVNQGEPAVVYDQRIENDPNSKDIPFQMVQLFKGTDYITDKLLQDTATILNAFDTEIGIQTLPYQKAERMVAAEASSKQQESIARCTVWLNTLNESFDKVNKMFGTDLHAKLTFEPVAQITEGGGQNAGNDDIVGP